MQKALWLTALAFVAAAGVTVTLAEYGHNHPDTPVGRAVLALKGDAPPAAAPVAGPPARLMGGPMIDPCDADDRAALRDLKVLAYLQPDADTGLGGPRTEDFRDEGYRPVAASKPIPVVCEEEEGESCCARCSCMGTCWFMHRMACLQLVVCDCQHALGKVCGMMTARQTEAMRTRFVFVGQECCPPPCGFWKIVDGECCEEKPCCTPKPCCPAMPCVIPSPKTRLVQGVMCVPCMPCTTAPVIVVEHRREAQAVKPAVQLKIVSGDQNQELRISGMQIEIEIRLDSKGGMKAETNTIRVQGTGGVQINASPKKCCEPGCCAKPAAATAKPCCDEGCCTEAGCGKGCPCVAATKVKKAAAACKCGTECKCCKCGTAPVSDKKPEKPAACPGCCGEKKKTSQAEPEAKFDPALQQAGFSGVTSATRPLRLMTRMLPVGDLLDATGGSEDQLVDGCTMKVLPATWQVYGGMGQIVYYAPGRCLIVHQTEEVFEELEDYLDKLRKQAKPPVGPDNPEEGTYWLPFFQSQQFVFEQAVSTVPVYLELPASTPMILELVPVPSVDPSVPGFTAPVVTPERLPCCRASTAIGASVIQAQAVRHESSSWLFQLLVPYYSFEQ